MSAAEGPERSVVVTRNATSGLITASGGDGLAHGILERSFFLRERGQAVWHRLSPTIPPADERDVARVAVARLQAAGYRVLADYEFAWDGTEGRYVTTGREIENLASRIRKAASPEDLDYELGELTATHDGILASLGLVLHALADVADRAGDPGLARWAARLRIEAESDLPTIASGLRSVRNHLADRSAPSGRRGPHLPPPAPPAPPTSTASGRSR